MSPSYLSFYRHCYVTISFCQHCTYCHCHISGITVTLISTPAYPSRLSWIWIDVTIILLCQPYISCHHYTRYVTPSVSRVTSQCVFHPICQLCHQPVCVSPHLSAVSPASVCFTPSVSRVTSQCVFHPICQPCHQPVCVQFVDWPTTGCWLCVSCSTYPRTWYVSRCVSILFITPKCRFVEADELVVTMLSRW